MVTDSRIHQVYSKWLRVHPRYYDRYGYDAWKRFNQWFYDFYDIPYDYHVLHKKEVQRKKAVRSRINKYVRELANACEYWSRPYLLTLTWDDASLSSLSFDTRLRYVKSYVGSFRDYIGCIDFGKINHREHYHFIVDIGSDPYDIVKVGKVGRLFVKIRDKPDWSYGFISLCPITEDLKCASSYAFKSSNYAFKSADENYRVFHKRGASHWLDLIDDFDLMSLE